MGFWQIYHGHASQAAAWEFRENSVAQMMSCGYNREDKKYPTAEKMILYTKKEKPWNLIKLFPIQC